MIRAIAQDEKGAELGKAINISSSVIARPDDRRFVCLRFVDPYGDTVFNRLQLPVLIEDLQLLKTMCHQDQQGVLNELEELIRFCLTEPHLYLKMIGD